MELQQINNTSFINTNTLNTTTNVDLNSQIVSTSNEELTSNSIDIQKSAFSSSIEGYINNISTTNSLQSMVDTQNISIDQMKESLQNNSNNEQLQVEAANFISEFNRSVEDINDKLANLEDLKGTSTTYFDGEAGAIPLDISIFDDSLSSKQDELTNVSTQINDINSLYTQLTQQSIENQKQEVSDESPFQQLDFGKESSDFNKTNISNISGSIASVQANLSQTNALKLLV